MKLSPEQRRDVERLTVDAIKIARAICPEDEEAESAALLALCTAVRDWTGPYPLDKHARIQVRRRVKDYIKSKRAVLLPADRADTREGTERVDIEDLLSVLTTEDREIFVLWYEQKVSMRRLGKWKGCSTSTIWKIIQRCRNRLKAELL